MLVFKYIRDERAFKYVFIKILKLNNNFVIFFYNFSFKIFKLLKSDCYFIKILLIIILLKVIDNTIL